MNIIRPGGFEHFFEEIDQLPKDQPLDRILGGNSTEKLHGAIMPQEFLCLTRLRSAVGIPIIAEITHIGSDTANSQAREGVCP